MIAYKKKKEKEQIKNKGQTKNYFGGWNSWNDGRNGTYGRGLER